MSTLVVVGYKEPYQAEEVRLKLRKLQRDYLLELRGCGRRRQGC